MEEENIDGSRLREYVKVVFNRMFDEVLYDLESSLNSEYQFQVIRRRFLRSGNNALRDIYLELDNYYFTRKNPMSKRVEYDVEQPEDLRRSENG